MPSDYDPVLTRTDWGAIRAPVVAGYWACCQEATTIAYAPRCGVLGHPKRFLKGCLCWSPGWKPEWQAE